MIKDFTPLHRVDKGNRYNFFINNRKYIYIKESITREEEMKDVSNEMKDVSNEMRDVSNEMKNISNEMKNISEENSNKIKKTF